MYLKASGFSYSAFKRGRLSQRARWGHATAERRQEHVLSGGSLAPRTKRMDWAGHAQPLPLPNLAARYSKGWGEGSEAVRGRRGRSNQRCGEVVRPPPTPDSMTMENINKLGG